MRAVLRGRGANTGEAEGRAGHEVARQRVLPDHGNRREGLSEAQPGQFDLITNGIKDETDTANQIRIVEQMIVSKVDAIVLAPADSKALVPVVKKAVDAGIIVVNIDNRLDPDVLKSKDLNVPFVGPDNRKGAQKVGDYLAKKLKSGDEVGIIEGVSTTTNAQQRTAGFKDAMEKSARRSSRCNRANGKSTRATRSLRHVERISEPEGAARRQRQHGDRRGLGGARGRQAGQGAMWSATTISTRSNRC